MTLVNDLSLSPIGGGFLMPDLIMEPANLRVSVGEVPAPPHRGKKGMHTTRPSEDESHRALVQATLLIILALVAVATVLWALALPDVSIELPVIPTFTGQELVSLIPSWNETMSTAT